VARTLAIASPLLLVAVGAASQHLFGRWLGVWAWAPTMLLFWALIVSIVHGLRGKAALAGWLGPARGHWLWGCLAVGMGLLSLHGFLLHWTLLLDPWVLAAWLTFALINPWLEEVYWRGLLMDATRHWGAVASVVYSSVWFAVSHPLIWGVHTTAMRLWPVVAALLFVGLVWGLVYRRTGTLRWTIAGHMLANLLGLAVPVLLNLHNPAAR
jgi:membrane protease YdiL (CAAX protease family)